MKIIYFLFSALLLLSGTACERKLTAAELKENLEKAMSAYLQKQQPRGAAPLQFEMVDVTWFEDSDNYLCDFKVKLHRPGSSDTTGIISSKVSKDFSKVSKR
jgi:hypothetical protein